jgi:transcriptional antiterminator RfaH
MERWYVVKTLAQREERARAHLLRQGFDVYLPKWRKRRSHARRVDWIAAPLFPRYMFIRFDIGVTRWRVIQSTIGVSHLVCNGSLPLPVPNGIVEDLQARETQTGYIDIQPAFRKGQAVIVDDGPFLDQVGLFEHADDRQRVTVLLALLGREVRLKVPAYAVRAVA